MTTRTSSSARALVSLTAVIGLAFAGVASGVSVTGFERVAWADASASDIATARALVAEGRKLRAAGDFKQAIVKLEAAFSLYRTPVTGNELALAYRDGLKLVEARETALTVVKMPVEKDEGKASEAARAQCESMVKELALRIAQLSVVLTGVPEGASVTTTIDGQTVPAAALSVPRMVNPGKHLIVAILAGVPEQRAEVELKEGESKTVEVAFPTAAVAPPAQTAAAAPPPPGPTTTPPPPKPWSDAPKASPVDRGSGPGWLTWVGFSVAGVGGIVGTIAGFSALSASDRLDRNCGSDHLCPAREDDTMKSLDRSATISTVSFVLAGVGLALGIVDVTTGLTGTKREPRATVSLGVGPGTVGLSGSF